MRTKKPIPAKRKPNPNVTIVDVGGGRKRVADPVSGGFMKKGRPVETEAGRRERLEKIDAEDLRRRPLTGPVDRVMEKARSFVGQITPVEPPEQKTKLYRGAKAIEDYVAAQKIKKKMKTGGSRR